MIMINDNVIEKVNATKFLGVYINQSLSWKDHISYISNKLSKNIAILYHVSFIINVDLYCTLILPYLSYCSMVLENTYTTNLIPLYLKQIKAIRIVCNLKYGDHTPELFYDTNLLTIYQNTKRYF